MKKLIAGILAVSAIAAAAPASAQAWQNINQRQAQLDRRIDVGVRNGQLTRREAEEMRRQFRVIANLETTYRRSGGGLSRWERQDLDRRFDHLASRIRYERHDQQDRRR